MRIRKGISSNPPPRPTQALAAEVIIDMSRIMTYSNGISTPCNIDKNNRIFGACFQDLFSMNFLPDNRVSNLDYPINMYLKIMKNIKLKCHSERSEESLIFLSIFEILRCTQNDIELKSSKV